MKFLIKSFLVILALFAIVLIAAAFIDGNYSIEKEVIISKPLPEVFKYIKYVKNQDHFSLWNQRDPNMKKDYEGNDGEVGFIYSWNSTNEKVGVGEQEIMKITPSQRVDLKLRFKIPFEAEDDAYLSTEIVDSLHTKVKWGFAGKYPYPFTIMKLFLDMDKVVGKDLADGLTNLKVVLEKK